MSENNINVGGRLHSIATGNVLAGSDEILDDAFGKKQSQVNIETYALVESVNNALASLSPEQQGALTISEKANNNEVKLGYYVCQTEGNVAAKTIAAANYILGSGGSIKIKMNNANTADNATLNINSTGAKALYYDGERASANNSWEAGETVEVYYDGTSYYANNVAGGSGSGDGAFDVSAKYPTSGVEGGNTYTLEGALAVLNANLSASKKKGGMSIKFVQSSDNNSTRYVQYRYMSTSTANADFVKETNWQECYTDAIYGHQVVPLKYQGKYIVIGGIGTAVDINSPNTASQYNSYMASIDAGSSIIINARADWTIKTYAILDSNFMVLNSLVDSSEHLNLKITAPENAAYIVINSKMSGFPNSYYSLSSSIDVRFDNVLKKIDNDIEFATVVSTASGYPLAFDSANKTLTILNSSRIIFGRKQSPVYPFANNIVLDITSYKNGILLFNTSYTTLASSSFLILKYDTTADLAGLSDEKYVIICAWKNYGADWVNSNASYAVDGFKFGNVLDSTPTAESSIGVSSGGVASDLAMKSNVGILINYDGKVPLQFSYTNRTCTIPSSTRLFLNSKKIDVATATLDLTSVTTGGVIVYDITSSAFAVMGHNSTSYDKNKVIIATFTGLGSNTGTPMTINTTSLYSINGKWFGRSNIGILFFRNDKCLQFDSINGTCTIPANTIVLFQGTGTIISSTATTLDIRTNIPNGGGSIIYNYLSNTVAVKSWQANIQNDSIILATFSNFDGGSYRPLVSCPSYYTIDGVPYGMKYSDIDYPIEILSPEYETIQLPNGITWWSDFIVVNVNGVDEMWFFAPSGDETHTSANGSIHRVKMSDWTLIDTIKHDFGHCNTCSYDAASDVLLIGNLPGNDTYPAALYIFYNVSSWVSESGVTFANENPTIVDLSSLNMLRISACFAENNNGKRNIVQVQDYTGTSAKLLLGMGANELDNGILDNNHTQSTDYNGTFKILNTFTYKTLYSPANEVIQGEDFYDGGILTSNGHGTLRGFRWVFTADGVNRKEIRLATYADDGNLLYNTSEGITVKDEYIYQGFIPVTNSAGTIKDSDRPFAIVKYKVL